MVILPHDLSLNLIHTSNHLVPRIFSLFHLLSILITYFIFSTLVFFGYIALFDSSAFFFKIPTPSNSELRRVWILYPEDYPRKPGHSAWI